jgi:hypothetical protein
LGLLIVGFYLAMMKYSYILMDEKRRRKSPFCINFMFTPSLGIVSRMLHFQQKCDIVFRGERERLICSVVKELVL